MSEKQLIQRNFFVRHTCNKVKIRSGGFIIKYWEVVLKVKLTYIINEIENIFGCKLSCF